MKASTAEDEEEDEEEDEDTPSLDASGCPSPEVAERDAGEDRGTRDSDDDDESDADDEAAENEGDTDDGGREEEHGSWPCAVAAYALVFTFVFTFVFVCAFVCTFVNAYAFGVSGMAPERAVQATAALALVVTGPWSRARERREQLS